MITVRFCETWPLRRAEWMLAFVLLGCGIVFAVEPKLTNEASFRSILDLMPRAAWATWAIVVGVLRLAMLYINGNWRASPHLRALGAFLACFIWCALMIRAAVNPILIPSAACWPIFLLFDSCAAYSAAGDARCADERARRRQRDEGSADASRG